MDVASWLLFLMGFVGAADIVFYHTLAQHLHAHPPARAELAVHSWRGPTYLLLFVLVPNFALHGAWYWTLLALLAIDLAISVCDFALEKESRRELGGLPTGEYLLHVLLAILFGGFVTAIATSTWNWRALPTELVYAPAAVPALLRVVLAIMGIVNLASATSDGLAARRLGRAA